MVKTLAILLFIYPLAIAQDWCNIPYCTAGTHIACNHDGQFDSECVNPATVTFTPAEKQLFLDEHNKLRNDVAAGLMTGYEDVLLPPATRMAKMQWSDELAEMAELNTRSCKMAHDKCRGLSAFNKAGQNLAMMYKTTINITTAIPYLIDLWRNEQQYVCLDDIAALQSVSSSCSGKVIGHWTAMVNEKMTHIGCGMSTFDSIVNGYLYRTGLLACNYAFNNFIGRRVYRSGAIASDCVTGRDSTYNNVCTINEPIDPNNTSRLSVL